MRMSLIYLTLKGLYYNSHGRTPWTDSAQKQTTLNGLYNNNSYRENLLIME